MLSVRSFLDLNNVINANLHRLDRSQYDVVVGIPRSGMLPASILATQLQLPLADPRGYAADIIHGKSGMPEKRGSRILLVDDSCNKGNAMARAVDHLTRNSRPKITRLAIFGPYQVDPASVCDMSFETVHGPRVFAWNLWKHIRLPNWGFDFDGVFCRDPEKHENDDGPAYQKFISCAEPIFLPSRPIGHIVTGRLEKYRAQTEDWLGRRGIQFTKLHMMPYSTKAERMAAGNRGQWKAEIAKSLGVEMFIESCPKQASVIARMAQIPVWCTRTQSLASA